MLSTSHCQTTRCKRATCEHLYPRPFACFNRASRRQPFLNSSFSSMRYQAILWIALLMGTVQFVDHFSPAWAAELPPPAKQEVVYERDIQPLLTRSCLTCHGPDEQQSSFRVDQRKALLTGGDYGEPTIVPGDSKDSPLVQIVAGHNEDLVMPPEGEAKPLSADEIALLRAWIDQGAVMPETPAGDYQLTTDHWSFQPLTRPEVPKLEGDWVTNPIDAFILKRLREEQLAPNPRADKRELIRRVYLDMLGLLPTPEEVDSFIANESPQAYEQLVNRVLASEHYGERWAKHWLDVVRFAESNGFETNYERPNAYHYRDWVIQSLNEDLPYDEFVFAQLAGDSSGQDAATGFLVGGAYDKVKSPDPTLTLMQRQDELADMINTTGTAFLGLTLGCARCHTHKFDPILQKDYYSLQAVFAGVNHGERKIRRAADEDSQQRLANVEAELAKLRGELASFNVLPPVNAKINEEPLERVEARYVRFTIDATNTFEPCLDEIEIWTAGDESENVALASTGAKATSSGDYQGNPKHKLEHINDGQYSNNRSWISNTSGKGWVQIELAQTHTIDRIVWGRDRTLEYSDRLATKYRIEVATEPEKWEVVADSDRRMPIGGSSNPADFVAAGLSESDAARAAEISRTIAKLQSERDQLDGTAMAYAGTFSQPPETHRLYRGDPMAPRERVAPETLQVLHSPVGALDLNFDAPEQQRRIELAKWIVANENPLTARVIVNRLWHYHFGRGIVATPSDFGAMGFKPTHPELLDWLASELIEPISQRPSLAKDGLRPWSLKHIHRLILLSTTYQQSSAPRADAVKKDRDANLLWRFPPRRLEAEAIRDNILSVSGVLDRTMYGPGFMVFQPNSNYSRNWIAKDDFGPAEFRRMVYALDLRMEHDAVFGAFDCPDGGQVTPKRSRSTTPIQALNLYNSNFIQQQASLFAERVKKDVGNGVDGSSAKRQAALVFELALLRQPTNEELIDAVQLIESHGLNSLCRAIYNTNEFLFLQ